MNNHFIFNEDLCVGCEACVVACRMENGTDSFLNWRNVISTNRKKLPGIPIFNLSMSCNHCDEPPCMLYCPANAYEIDNNTGAVLVVDKKCMGCEYCTWNCPYDSPVLNRVKGVVEKCTFCNSRLLDGRIPACANLCPTGALDFSSQNVDIGITQNSIPDYPGPSIIIHESHRTSGPEIDNSLFSYESYEPTTSKSNHSFTGIREWPLIIFTFITSVLVAIAAAPYKSMSLPEIKYVVTGLIIFSTMISIMHLGKKIRFIRSILNFRKSWLSREILFFGVFSLFFVLDLYIIPIPRPIIVFLGLSTLLSVDMLYRPLQYHWRYQLHSGQTIPVAISLTMIISGFYLAVGLFLVLRLAYTISVNSHNITMTVLRYLFPLKGMILLYTGFSPELGIGLLIIGEFIDRLLFYSDLKKPLLAKYTDS